MLSTERKVAALPTKGLNHGMAFVKRTTSQLSLLKIFEGIAQLVGFTMFGQIWLDV
jgi:hypothetical protein